MNGYALIKDSVVFNVVVWDGEAEAEVNFGDGVIAIAMPDRERVDIGYSYEDGKFVAPPLTAEELAAQESAARLANMTQKENLMTEASQRISVLQDAVDLEMATDEEVAALPL